MTQTDAADVCALEEATSGLSSAGNRRVLLIIVLSSQFTIMGAMGSINIALPWIRTQLGINPAQIQWVLVLFQLSYALMLIPGGRLGDMFGIKRMFVVGFAGFVAATLVASVAPGIGVLLVARVCQGAFCGLAAPQLLASIQVSFPAQERNRALAGFAMVGASGYTLGQLISGGLLSLNLFHTGWRGTFFVYVLFGLVGLLAAPARMPNIRPRDVRQRLDVGGIGLLLVGGLMLMYPLIQGRSAGWPLYFFVAVALAVPMLAAFIKHESRQTRLKRGPLIDLSLFQSRAFKTGLMLAGLLSGMTLAEIVYMTFTLQNGFHLSPFKTALAITLTTIFNALGAGISSWLFPRMGRKIFSLCAAVIALAGAVLVAVLARSPNMQDATQILPVLPLIGLGGGMCQPSIVTVTLSEVRHMHAGTASGVLQMIQQSASALSIALFGVVYWGVLGNRTTTSAYISAMKWSMAPVFVLSLTLYLVHFLLPRDLVGTSAPIEKEILVAAEPAIMAPFLAEEGV